MLRGVTQEDEVIAYMEQGYLPIGTSSFTAPHCTWTFLIDLAQEKGADLVLIDATFKKTKTYTSVLFLPQTQTSYTYGSVNAYSRYGSTYGSYSATTTTTSVQAVPVQKEVDIFNQTVMFMRKANFANFFGAILYVPKRVPGVNDDEFFRVTILAILKGSEAERQGLKKGQKVVKINNKEIKTRKDYAQFLNKPNTITSIEVAQ